MANKYKSICVITPKTRDIQIKNNNNQSSPLVEWQKNNKRRLILSKVGKDVGNCCLLMEQIDNNFC